MAFLTGLANKMIGFKNNNYITNDKGIEKAMKWALNGYKGLKSFSHLFYRVAIKYLDTVCEDKEI